jgi:hypothetical protein
MYTHYRLGGVIVVVTSALTDPTTVALASKAERRALSTAAAHAAYAGTVPYHHEYNISYTTR